MVDDGPVHVAFTSDGGYAMPLAAAICSAAINLNSTKRIIFHVFHHDFLVELRDKVEASLASVASGNASIVWQDASVDRLKHLRVVHDNHNSLIYLRLLLPELLPPDIEKVIYLDADVIVLDDIASLWSEPCGEAALLAVRDRIGTVSGTSGLSNFRELDIAADAAYFNSGVLVLNLARWRDEDLSARVIQYLEHHPNDLQMGDQDGLNAVLFDKWRELDFRWNWQAVPDRRRAIKAGCWGLELTEKSIVHFVTPAKPWLPGSLYDERHLFFHYLDKTAWRGWRVPVILSAKTQLKRLLWPLAARLRSRRRRVTGETA